MKTLQEYINEALVFEKFVNLFDKDIEIRRQYSKEVWDMVERAYAYMDGLSGCTTYEQFVNKLLYNYLIF